MNSKNEGMNTLANNENTTLSREQIINAIYLSSIDYIPVLIEPDNINKFIVVDRITLTSVLNESFWEYSFQSLCGWGYDTPTLEIKANNFLFKSIKCIEIYLPKESFINLGYKNFIQEDISFNEIDDSLIHIDILLADLDKIIEKRK